MRNLRAFHILIIAGVLLVPPVAASADPPSVVGRLNLATGPVSFLPGSIDQWAPAVTNYPLSEGDHLWVDQGGRAEIHVGSMAVRLDEDTEMSFLSLDERTVQLGLSQGSLNVRLRYLEPGDVYEIDTPNSVITLLQTGSYRIDATPDGDISLTVRQGAAEVAAANDIFNIRAGTIARISGTDWISYYVQRAPGMDSWDSWSASRDAREDRLASIRYVPREMVGMEDLDDNGDWFTISGYGPVWSPNRVPAGWAPYRYGRWAWVTPWGWTWIDDAPWGFTPFHYGRWAFIQSRWVWIPGTIVARPVYAPALVVFVGGSASDNVGWFPLGPREIYIPPYQASSAYVHRINVTNVTNITIQIIEQTNVTRVSYVNRNVRSAVTVLPRRSFVQSRPTSESAITNTAEARRLTVVSTGASLQPERESVFGQALSSQRTATRPPAGASTRQVFSRTAPASPRQSFVSSAAGRETQPAPVSTPNPQARVVVVDPSNRVQNPPATRSTATQQQPTRSGQTASGRETPAASATTARGQSEGDLQKLLTLLNARSLPDAEKHLEAAKGARGIRLDYNGLKKRLSDLRKRLAVAQNNQKAGKTDLALQQGQGIQRELDDVEKIISDALRAAGGNDNSRQPQQSSGQGDARSNPGRPTSP